MIVQFSLVPDRLCCHLWRGGVEVRGSDAGIVLIVIVLSLQPVVFENVMLSVSIL
jgi:hypothetical protein